MDSPKTKYKLLRVWETGKLPPNMTDDEMHSYLENLSTLSDEPWRENVMSTCPMPFHEELLACSLWFIFFGCMMYLPLVLIYLLIFHQRVGIVSILILSVIVYLPTNYNPKVAHGKIATIMLKYFSFRGLWSVYLPKDAPAIIVGPPHGVFPFGSILVSN